MPRRAVPFASRGKRNQKCSLLRRQNRSAQVSASLVLSRSKQPQTRQRSNSEAVLPRCARPLGIRRKHNVRLAVKVTARIAGKHKAHYALSVSCATTCRHAGGKTIALKRHKVALLQLIAPNHPLNAGIIILNKDVRHPGRQQYLCDTRRLPRADLKGCHAALLQQFHPRRKRVIKLQPVIAPVKRERRLVVFHLTLQPCDIARFYIRRVTDD
jgi:hypothetical protein